MTKRLAVLAACLAFGAANQAHAGFTEVDISPYLNGHVSANPSTYPVGLSSGNTGTGVPFETYAYGGSGDMGSAFLAGDYSPGTSSSLTIDLSALNISGQSSFYALLNNYFGSPGSDEYNVIIGFSNGDSVTYPSIGGVDTRDYNQNSGTSNTIADTTSNWFTNGIGQRLDVREFTIPTEYQTDQITSFTIDQLVYHDPAFLSGITFSTDSAVVLAPEPASLALMGVGVLGLGLTFRRRARAGRPTA